MSRRDFHAWKKAGIFVAKTNHFPALACGAPMERADLRRIEDFFDGKFSPSELVLFAQDVLEAGEVFHLGPNVARLVQHAVDVHLCTIPGSGLQ